MTPHSHDANEAIQSADEASGAGIRAAWIGLAGMSATALAQLLIVAISGSVALLADTVHNLGHAVTTIPLLIAFRLGRHPPSRRYSYGYRRAEDLAGLFIGLVVAISAAIVIYEAIGALMNPYPITDLGWVLTAGIVGFLGNELVAVYRIRVGGRIGSAALVAEGQHARADGLTSLAVVGGVLGVWLGFEQADAIIGLLIGAVILWILVSSMRTVVRRLMDGVDDDTVDHVERVLRAVPGVHEVDHVRMRWTGHRLEGDASIQVPEGLDVVAAHTIAEDAQHRVLHAVPHVESVLIHLHPPTPPSELEELHELTAHHATAEARDAYHRKLADAEGQPAGRSALPGRPPLG